MITYIKINGFKSFQNFEMILTPLTIIAGTNAAGKSNLFDALRLLSRLAEVDKIHTAFREEQRGEMHELFTQYDDDKCANEMEFVVEMLVNKNITDAWGASDTLKYTRLHYELKIRHFINESGLEDLEVIYESLNTIRHNEDDWIKLIPKEYVEKWRPKVVTGKRGMPYIHTDIQNGVPVVCISQDGKRGNKRSIILQHATRTVLSSIDSVDFRHILAAKEEMKSWRFLQLNPEDLRQPTSKKTGEDMISFSGKNLAAALYRIKQNNPYSIVEISRKLNQFIPNYIDVIVKDDTENKQYIIYLKGEDGKEYSSRVLSEGTLRMLTLCILEQDEKHTGLLCFEEPENGIHPFRIKTMVDLLKDLSTDFTNTNTPLRQVIVNTHSPILVKEIHNWKNDKDVSLNFASMRTRIQEFNGKKQKTKVTTILPVEKDGQLTLKFSEQDMKMSLQTVTEYLSSLNGE
ncbi:MAG: AAA family ATPase [Bacteroidales bacterium]|nr:AAA family ATPase [Bacteroidales bacterium]